MGKRIRLAGVLVLTLIAFFLWTAYVTRDYEDNQRNWLHISAIMITVLLLMLGLVAAVRALTRLSEADLPWDQRWVPPTPVVDAVLVVGAVTGLALLFLLA